MRLSGLRRGWLLAATGLLLAAVVAAVPIARVIYLEPDLYRTEAPASPVT